MGPIRVLCLHGWRTNGRILAHQSRSLQKQLGDAAEWDFLDAPHAATGKVPEDVQEYYPKQGNYNQWFDSVKLEEVEGGESKYSFKGVEQSIEYVKEKIEKDGPFDAILGFSQGSGLITILNAYFLHHTGTVPWKVAVLVAGFPPRGVEVLPYLADADGTYKTINVPSIHVYGEKDFNVHLSRKLYKVYAGEDQGCHKVLLEHDEGHKFPSVRRHPQVYETVARELLLMTQDAPTARL